MAAVRYENITVRMLLNHSSGFPGTDDRNCVTGFPVPGYLDQVTADAYAADGRRFTVLAGDRLTAFVTQKNRIDTLCLSLPESRPTLSPLGVSTHLTLFPQGQL
jgi:hypothetical protein